MALWSKYTRALTFENFCQAASRVTTGNAPVLDPYTHRIQGIQTQTNEVHLPHNMCMPGAVLRAVERKGSGADVNAANEQQDRKPHKAHVPGADL